MRLFLSYRRSDAQSAARQLAEALERRLGDDSVFFDVADLELGDEWLEKIRDNVEAADVVLAVIGPHWLDVLDERSKRMRRDGRYEDVMRLEIETALRAGANVVPVLVDDAQMPDADALPRPFRPLAGIQARALSSTSWERDVDALAKALAQLPPREPRLPRQETPAPGSRPRTDAARIARYMADGSVVTVLGAGVNAADRSEPWQMGNGALPDTDELARHLARRFAIGVDRRRRRISRGWRKRRSSPREGSTSVGRCVSYWAPRRCSSVSRTASWRGCRADCATLATTATS